RGRLVPDRRRLRPGRRRLLHALRARGRLLQGRRTMGGAGRRRGRPDATPRGARGGRGGGPGGPGALVTLRVSGDPGAPRAEAPPPPPVPILPPDRPPPTHPRPREIRTVDDSPPPSTGNLQLSKLKEKIYPVAPHAPEHRVRWSEVDPAGIVFYPRFFEWFDL